MKTTIQNKSILPGTLKTKAAPSGSETEAACSKVPLAASYRQKAIEAKSSYLQSVSTNKRKKEELKKTIADTKSLMEEEGSYDNFKNLQKIAAASQEELDFLERQSENLKPSISKEDFKEARSVINEEFKPIREDITKKVEKLFCEMMMLLKEGDSYSAIGDEALSIYYELANALRTAKTTGHVLTPTRAVTSSVPAIEPLSFASFCQWYNTNLVQAQNVAAIRRRAAQ